MDPIECWRWRYRDAASGAVCRTSHVLSVDEAAVLYPGAEPIDGTHTLRRVEEPAFCDTLPWAHEVDG